MSSTASLKDIVDSMSNELNNSTLGWDVVVNYKESEINKLLKDTHKNNPKDHIMELQVSITVTNDDDDSDADPYDIDYDFKFGPPLIKFEGSGSEPSCTLTIPINGGTTATIKTTTDSDGNIKKTAKAKYIHDGVYELQLSNLKMASMSGSADNPAPTSSSKPFVFTTQSASAFVTIDFKASCKLTVHVLTKSDKNHDKRVGNHKGDLQNKIYEYFTDKTKRRSIRYKLAKVDSTAPSAGCVSMQPKSFLFATFVSQKFSTTILSLFIQTAEKLTGTVTDLQNHWTGRWTDTYKVPPIPSSHTASIIFNNATMHKSVISPAIKASGVDTDDPVFEKGQGFHYKFRTHKKVSRSAVNQKYEKTDRYSVDLDEDANTLRLTLGQNGDHGTHAKGSITWNYKYSFGYRRYEDRVGPQGTTITVCYDEGTITVTNSLNQRNAFSDILSNSELDMKININKEDWKAKVNKESHDWLNILFGTSSSEWYSDEAPKLPSFEIKLGSLYFFLTTNLLMPGEKVINIDSSAGLRIPHDYYIVGNVISNEKK